MLMMCIVICGVGIPGFWGFMQLGWQFEFVVSLASVILWVTGRQVAEYGEWWSCERCLRRLVRVEGGV